MTRPAGSLGLLRSAWRGAALAVLTLAGAASAGPGAAGAAPVLPGLAGAAPVQAGLAGAAPAVARDPPQDPVLRIEAGMHTTLIRRIAVDAPRQRLVTCSDDKTVRVWQLPEMRLVTTLRVPIGQGHEGQLFAVSVSPDGATVVAGGWTGWDWDGAASLYVFDVASGQLVRRIGGYADAIHALAWTRDGEHLLVGLQGRGGLHRVRVADGQVVASDAQYLDKVMEIDERADGLVAAVALDGMVRLYTRELQLLGRRATAGAGAAGARPSSVRFSPDGRLLAVGHVDRPLVTVLQARDLAESYRPVLDPAPGQVSTGSVAWSSDGRHLYAGGEWRAAGASPLYRWPDAGRGRPERLPLAANRLSDLQTLPDGAIAYAAEDPGLGVVGADGRRSAWRGPDSLDFSAAQGRILLAADGRVVGYPVPGDGSGSPAMHHYAPLLKGDQALDAAPAEPLHGPVLQAPGLVVEHWQDGFEPRINGQRPLLDEHEKVRSLALAPGRHAALLGTEWALRLFDGQARALWSVKLPAVAYAVNVSRDERLAVAALSDGSLRWYRLADGREELAYFPHRDGREWIAWVPEGYYTSSVQGDRLVGWHVNRGRDLTPDFHRAVQFDRILFRPDVVAAAFRSALATGAAPDRKVALKALGADFEIRRLADIAPPRLTLVPRELVLGRDGRPRAVLELRAEVTRRGIQDLSVFVNKIAVTPGAERRVSGAEARQLTRRLELDLAERANEIRVEAFNGASMGVAETTITLPEGVRATPPPGDLYVLAVGVNAFPQLPARMHLAYAVRDAQELAAALQARTGGQFAQVHVQQLTDDSAIRPDRAAVLRALAALQRARPQDTVVVFLASHGVSDAAGNYYFVPRDVRAADLQALQAGRKPASLLPWTAFFDALRATAGRRLLIVDTCQARAIEGRFEPHALLKRSAASLFPMIVAAKGDEESQEYAAGRHGLFTYALLQAMAPASDTDGDGRVSLAELFEATRPVVERLRDPRAGPQTPQLVAPPPLGGLGLMRVGPR